MQTVDLIVVMGVSGSGKSAIGSALAEGLAIAYGDGDDLHPTANVEKMAAGEPLTDDDRWPWLQRCGAWLHDHANGGGVLACSALKRSYRDRLRTCEPAVSFVELDVPAEVLRDRLSGRKGHFMPVSLLDSQLATLEPLAGDEPGVRVPVGAGASIAETVAQVRALLGRP